MDWLPFFTLYRSSHCACRAGPRNSGREVRIHHEMKLKNPIHTRENGMHENSIQTVILWLLLMHANPSRLYNLSKKWYFTISGYLLWYTDGFIVGKVIFGTKKIFSYWLNQCCVIKTNIAFQSSIQSNHARGIVEVKDCDCGPVQNTFKINYKNSDFNCSNSYTHIAVWLCMITKLSLNLQALPWENKTCVFRGSKWLITLCGSWNTLGNDIYYVIGLMILNWRAKSITTMIMSRFKNSVLRHHFPICIGFYKIYYHLSRILQLLCLSKNFIYFLCKLLNNK